jgi:hypothetical protein
MLAGVLSAAIAVVFALGGIAMGLGCWYAYRALHPRPEGQESLGTEPSNRI